MPQRRAASPREAQRQRDEDTVRAHVRRALVGLTPADTRATPDNLERLTQNIVESASRDLPASFDESVLRRVLTEELLLCRDNRQAERRAEEARASLRLAQERLRNMTPPPSLVERDPAARARLSPIKSPPVRPRRPHSRESAAGSQQSMGVGLRLGDVSAGFDDVEAAPDLRVRRRYFLRGLEDSGGEFPRHGHFDCTLDHDHQLGGPEQYLQDRFRVSFVDALDSAHKLTQPPDVVVGAADDGSSTLSVDPHVLGRWLSSKAPYSRSDAPALFILCRDVLRHLLNDRLELESAKANRLANELEASRAECAAERAETEKVRAMLSNKLRRLDERVAAKQQQIDALEAEKQGVLATLQERSDQLVDAQAELFLSEAKKVG